MNVNEQISKYHTLFNTLY